MKQNLFIVALIVVAGILAACIDSDILKEPKYSDILLLNIKEIEKEIPDLKKKWDEYKTTLQLQLPKSLEESAYLNFGKNSLYIDKFNKLDLQYKLGINRLAHLSDLEYKSLLGTTIDVVNDTQKKIPLDSKIGGTDISIDLRELGYVSSIKDQGSCGSCYSFSSLAAVESLFRNKLQELYSLSEQQLIDCSLDYGNNGCNGGSIGASLSYIMHNAIINGNEYLYKAKVGECLESKYNGVSNITTYEFIPVGDEIKIAEYIKNHAVVSVAIDSSLPSFKFYKSGIYSSPECSSTKLNHGVAVIGASSSKDGKYWIIKNSWGESWGLEGYGYLAKDQNNMCGIATNARVPIL